MLKEEPEILSPSTASIPQPNFFIVGAAKSGTTSLWMYLKQHPEVYMPQAIEHKEPAFFCDLYGYKDFDAYLSLFSEAKDKKAIGEASHAYLTSPESAAWIQKVYPDAKIIIILRNPVERAYSLYNWMIAAGYEWIYPFEKALIVEEERLKDNYFKHHNPEYFYNYLYFSSGLYASQLERYFQLFARDKIQILLFEDLKNEPVVTTQKVYSFLEVDNSFIPQIDIHNQAHTPFSVSAQYFLRRKLPKYLRKYRIPGVKKIQKNAFNTNLFLGQFRSKKLQDLTKNGLQEKYKKDLQKTASLIKRDLKSWLQ
jgi:hypothetical protein